MADSNKGPGAEPHKQVTGVLLLLGRITVLLEYLDSGEILMISFREHFEALRALDKELSAERDRRYKELAEAQEKALRIKQTADEKALDLSRATQEYKDEKANNLRTQIENERGNYSTKDDLANAVRELNEAIKPLTEYVARQGGRALGVVDRRLNVGEVLQALITIASLLTVLVLVFHH